MNRGWLRVIVAATGPSFSASQSDLIEHYRFGGIWHVIAVNDNWLRLPNADILYAADGRWLRARKAAGRPSNIEKIRAAHFRGEIWTQSKKACEEFAGLNLIKGWTHPGLTSFPDQIHNGEKGKNSTFQAINLAYLFGAQTIVLAGLDMQRTGGLQHWFGDHPEGLVNNIDFAKCIADFERLAHDLQRAGIECVNCSAETALQCFRRMDLAEALCTL